MGGNTDIITYIRLIGSDYSQTSEDNTKDKNDNIVDNIIPMNVGLTSSYIKNLISDLPIDHFDEDIILDHNKRCRYIKIDLPFDQKLIYYFKEIMVNFFLGEISEESTIKELTIKELMIKESKMKDSIRNNALMAVSENRDILEITRYMDVRSSRSELYELLLRVMADYIFDKYQNQLHLDSDEVATRIMKYMDEEKKKKMIYPNWLVVIMMKYGICDKDKYMLFAKNFIKKYIDTNANKDVDTHKDVDTTIDELKNEYTDLFEEIEKCFSEIITYDSLPISVPSYEGNISSITRFKDKHFHPIRPTSIKYSLHYRLSIKNNKLHYEGINFFTNLPEGGRNPNINIVMDVCGVEKISAGSIFIAAVSKGKLILGGTLWCMMNRSDPKTRSFLKMEDILIEDKKYGKVVLTKINYFNKVDIIACGFIHIVLLADGEVYILGKFLCENGKILFDNKVKDISEMNFQKLTFFSGKRVTKIECGSFNFTVIADGKLYVFGPNYCGSLGLNNIINNNWDDEFFNPDYSNIPCLDFGEKRVTDVSSNISHTAILVDGELYTVGKNKSGELGLDKEIGILFRDNDESKGRYQPVPMKVDFFTGKNITHISCGAKHTSVVADNKLYVFGKINIQPEYMVQDEENMGNIFRVILKDPTKKIVDLSSGTGKTSIIVM